MLFQYFWHHFIIHNCVKLKSIELLLILGLLIIVFSRSTFLWRSTSMTLWQTAPSPLRVLKMAKRDWRHEKKQKSSVPGWIPGNNLFFPFVAAHLFFFFFSLHPLLHRGQNGAGTFYEWQGDGRQVFCAPWLPQGNADELNLWPLSVIGQQNYKSIRGTSAFTCKELYSKLLP